MNTSIRNFTSSLATSDESVYVSIWLVVICWFELSWIILSNGVIVTCYILNRQTQWPSFVKHVYFLTLNDLITSVISIPALINGMEVDVFASFGACLTTFYLFFFSQCTCLFHILGVCVHRYARLRATAPREERLNSKLPVLLSVASWMISCVLMAIPFLLWANPPSAKSICVVQELFGFNVHAARYFGITYLVPLVLTNTLYLVTVVRLKFIWRQAFNGDEFKLFARRLEDEKTNKLADEGSPSESQEFTPEDTQFRASRSNEVEIKTDRYYNRYSRSRIRMQRRVLGTIGLVTMFVDMFTIPYILLLLFWKVSGQGSRDMRFLSSFMLLLNSALNPFIYAYRTDWLNVRLKRMFVKK